ncbi:MAG: hypothetical protein P1V36_13955 [Planctomycetota bacterium]|nr:hypothetical protein [Planctomycetota bacterium]
MSDAPSPDPQPPFDPARFIPAPLEGRGHLVETGRFAAPVEPADSLAAFLDGLPDFLGVRNLRALAGAIAGAPKTLWGMGGHVVKVGLGPLFVDLAERGFAHGFVLNGAAAIHDSEVALQGSTSEDVGGGLFEGTYGTADETGRLFGAASARAVAEDVGFGTALGRELLDRDPPNAHLSVLCQAARAGLPVTVHVAVGTDTVHMHPACQGADVGTATHRDFLRLAGLVEDLDGGVYVNVGSAVILPEVFLKAVAMVHNAWANEGRAGEKLAITTGNLDMLRHYRPRVNVLERPAARGYDIAGQHEYVVPLLRACILHAAGEARA